MSSLIYWKCPVQLFGFFFPNSVFMIIFFILSFSFFLSFFFFPSFSITSCKDGILTSGLLDKTEMVPIFTIPHNVTVWFFPGACAPATPGRVCRQPGRWLRFGLRYPTHSGKNALISLPELVWDILIPKNWCWGQPCSHHRDLPP